MTALRTPKTGPDRTWSDRRLVDACLAGDSDAWSALLAKYKNLIYSIPLKFGASADDANDIFQAVCIELYNGLPTLRQVESLPGWIATVARHRSYHWKRERLQRVHREGTELDDAPPDRLAEADDDVIEQAQKEQGVRDAVAGLNDRCRRLVELLFFEQPPRPYADIAEELGLAIGSIGFIRGRCLKKLQTLLRKAGHT